MNEKERFSTRLKCALGDTGTSQKELAKRTGLTEATISRYVNWERIPNATTLKLIADALGVGVEYFFSDGEKENELKNCPFCNAGKEYIDERLVCPGIIQNFFVIRCTKCNAMIADMNESHCLRDIRRAWNRRDGMQQ